MKLIDIVNDTEREMLRQLDASPSEDVPHAHSHHWVAIRNRYIQTRALCDEALELFYEEKKPRRAGVYLWLMNRSPLTEPERADVQDFLYNYLRA